MLAFSCIRDRKTLYALYTILWIVIRKADGMSIVDDDTGIVQNSSILWTNNDKDNNNVHFYTSLGRENQKFL